MSAVLEPTPLKLRWYFSVAAVLFIFVVIGFYSVRMAKDTDFTDGYDQQQAVLRLKKLQKMQAADHTTLTTADWIDQDKGTVRIPIDEAMPEEVAVLKAKPVAVGSALPVVAPATAAPSTNAAPAAPASTNAAPAMTNTAPAATNASPTTPAAPTANAKPSTTATAPATQTPATKPPALKTSTAQPKTAK
jgi:hypothetical protein